MPLFECSKCGCIENTALSRYWGRFMNHVEGEEFPPALCSECDPEIKEWHDQFPKVSAKGCSVDEGGFLWMPDETPNPNVKIVGKVE